MTLWINIFIPYIVIKTFPQENEIQNGKMAIWGGLTIAEERREAKGKGEKEHPLECRVPKNRKDR